MSETPSLPSKGLHYRGENIHVNSADQRQHVRMAVMRPEEKFFLKRSNIIGKKQGNLLKEADVRKKNGNKYW